MVRGVGIDIIKTERMKKVIHRHKRILGRVFTPGEQKYCLARSKPYLHFAARFAAKEAVAKALGTGIFGFSWRDLEICRDDSGKPFVLLKNKALEEARKKEVSTVLISLSTTDEEAVAYALALGVE